MTSNFSTTNYFSGISLLALSAVQGYHGYVLFVWLYGICLGGYSYSLKMFTLERIRARHYTKAWSFIQGATSIPVLIGIPITGYINQTYPKAGYYFSFLTTIIGASLMFLVGTKKDQTVVQNNCAPIVQNCNMNNYNISSLNECICPGGPYNPIFSHDMNPYNMYRPTTNHYERVCPTYEPFERSNFHRHSYRHKMDHPPPQYLPKSLSYAANIEYSAHPNYKHVHHDDFSRYNHVVHSSVNNSRNNLRHSRSVPEGLARYDYYGSYKRPIIRNVQVIEQITTSV